MSPAPMVVERKAVIAALGDTGVILTSPFTLDQKYVNGAVPFVGVQVDCVLVIVAVLPTPSTVLGDATAPLRGRADLSAPASMFIIPVIS